MNPWVQEFQSLRAVSRSRPGRRNQKPRPYVRRLKRPAVCPTACRNRGLRRIGRRRNLDRRGTGDGAGASALWAQACGAGGRSRGRAYCRPSAWPSDALSDRHFRTDQIPRARIVGKEGKTTEVEEQGAASLSAPHPRCRCFDRFDLSFRNQHAPCAPGADIARQSGWESVLPQGEKFPNACLLPHRNCSRPTRVQPCALGALPSKQAARDAPFPSRRSERAACGPLAFYESALRIETTSCAIWQPMPARIRAAPPAATTSQGCHSATS